jgi:vacuolar protein sorting-associated protein 35
MSSVTFIDQDMAVFDEISHLSMHLYTLSANHQLSNIYEIVQYAGNIIPRLYLMFVTGAVYMRVSIESHKLGDSPHPIVTDILNDMLEMSRGVQHPIRGLFLRYFLSQLVRDHLPDSSGNEKIGTLQDSINFLLQNFIEMNKLWVRMQHQGPSLEREKREQERRELQLLVGSNLVRLSQLEEITLPIYRDTILPSIFDEIVSCHDVIAQEYLVDVIIQIFPDEFHLHCLDVYLQSFSKLENQVNVKVLVVNLINRFSGYATRIKDENRDNTSKLIEINLFDVFWTQITDLIALRTDFSLEDIMTLILALNELCLKLYPDQLEYLDKVLGKAYEYLANAELLEKYTFLMKGHHKKRPGFGNDGSVGNGSNNHLCR